MRKNKESNNISKNTRKSPKNTARNTIKEIHKNKAGKTKPSKKNNTSSENSKATNKLNSFANFIKSKETQFGFGLFLIIFSLYLFLSFISYLKNWHTDDNIVNSGLGIIFNPDVSVENSMGKLGAWLGYVFIKVVWHRFVFTADFYYNSILFLLRVKIISFFENIVYLIGSTLWFSVFMSAIFTRADAMIWGGLFGR